MAIHTTPDNVVTELIARVAAVRDVEPTELPPLGETIDVDALETLVNEQFSGTCVFTYADCEISVGGQGRIRVNRRLGTTDTAKRQRRRRRN